MAQQFCMIRSNWVNIFKVWVWKFIKFIYLFTIYDVNRCYWMCFGALVDKVSDDGDLGKYINFQIVSYAKNSLLNVFLQYVEFSWNKSLLNKRRSPVESTTSVPTVCMVLFSSPTARPPEGARSLSSQPSSATPKIHVKLDFYTQEKSFTFNPQIFTDNLLCCQERG